MTQSKLLPIALLYAGGREKIDGATRFQKLVFLTQRETDMADVFEYEAHQYGPYSVEFARTLDALVQKGYIDRNTVTNELGNQKHVFSLTVEGIQLAKEMVGRERFRPLFDIATEIKAQYNDRPLPDLLQYVYRNYEAMTVNTELDTDRLFDPEVESEFVRPASETETEWINEYLSDPELVENDDGTWTARDHDHELTALGETRLEARTNLAEVIGTVEGDLGDEVTDEFLESIGVDPEQARDDSVDNVPMFME